MGFPARILNTFISKEEFSKETAFHSFSHGQIIELYLPTGVVVSEPQIVVPSVARVYRTDLYLVQPPRHPRSSLLYYEELYKKEDFKGTSYEEAVYCWEVWNDGGCDGHVDYEHRGYVLSVLEPRSKAYPIDIFDPWDWKRGDLEWS